MNESTAARRAIVAAGAALLVASAVLLYATGHTVVPGSEDYRPGPVWRVWVPVVAAMVAIRLVPWTTPSGPVDERLRGKMRGRWPRLDLFVLAMCLLGFAAADPVLESVLHVISTALTPLSYFLAKAFFLFLVPVMLVGGFGVLRYDSGPDLPRLSLRVSEGWRWGGLAAIAVYALVAVSPWAVQPPMAGGTVPDRFTAVLVITISLLSSPILEEIFYRGMLQTRLEFVLGRWPGIVAASFAYSLFSLVGSGVPNGFPVALAMSVCVQGVAGVMFGYLWTRYRNMWLNIVLHSFITLLAPVPLSFWG
ncbi:CPBP family intramembrane glutamic endopeptidase [Nocardiopsis mangrovi]|uniref:CPBP family intramembrane glutamic endopeptidase n=1 Tax=Nocardiopsis mangrovi TaxID=1179818 RepID=A0ABV9DWR7_9ACTN